MAADRVHEVPSTFCSDLSADEVTFLFQNDLLLFNTKDKKFYGAPDATDATVALSKLFHEYKLVTACALRASEQQGQSTSDYESVETSTFNSGYASTESNFALPVKNISSNTSVDDMSHTSSKTWVSEKAKEVEKWATINAAMNRMYHPRCDPKRPMVAMVPRTFEEWLQHRYAMLESRSKYFAKLLKSQELAKTASPSSESKPLIPFGGKVFQDNRSAVLAQPTIWCTNWRVPERVTAEIWPSKKEFEYEGDERVKSNVKRYLPMIREHHFENPTVKWSLLKDFPMLPFDVIRKKPTAEDIYTHVEEIDEDDVAMLLNQEILDAITELD